jgi:YgiT-type zinc finger domain-containing protein
MYCQGVMERKTASFHVDRKGYHLVLDSVPAWVCTQCGEVYFEEAEVDVMQDVMQLLDKKTKQLAVV